MPENEGEITLGVLNAVQGDSQVTQRRVANELGVALGLVNAYLRRCVNKGYVKVRQAPPNRYAYYLTPKGFAEKSRLTAEYLSQSFNFFRRARAECSTLFAECEAAGWRRIALAGVSDLAEIAHLSAEEHGRILVGVVDGEADDDAFHGHPVVDDLTALGLVDAVMVTDLRTPQATFDSLVARVPNDRVLAPPLLGVARPDRG